MTFVFLPTFLSFTDTVYHLNMSCNETKSIREREKNAKGQQKSHGKREREDVGAERQMAMTETAIDEETGGDEEE